MSAKKQSSLLNFFKGPSTPSRKSTNGQTAVTKKDEKVEVEERPLKRVNLRDGEDSPVKSSSKRRRIVLSSDEEENAEELKPFTAKEVVASSTPKTPRTKAQRPSVSTPTSIIRRKAVDSPSRNALSMDMADSFISSFRAEEESLDNTLASVATLDGTIYQVDKSSKQEKLDQDVFEADRYDHETFQWLKPEKIKDAKGRLKSDPEYDCTTLWVPPEFHKSQTPGHRQWWTLKAANFDTILFFKVGKFYELYHMDAVVSVECLSLAYMRGNYAHTGFPEAAYGKFADQLVSRGYKVARVEQTETPQQLEERNSKKSGSKDKVVNRELCRVTTCATRTYGVLDGADSGFSSIESTSNYLLAIKEQVVNTKSVYGVCFIDTSIGQFCLGQFEDDDYRSYLRTLVACHTPAQIVLERGSLSSHSSAILNSMLMSVPKEYLAPKKQFYSADDTVKMMTNTNYLGSDANEWPAVLRQLLAPDSVLPAPNSSSNLVWSALGAVLCYLKRCLIDVDIVTMKNFTKYVPSVSGITHKSTESTESLWANRQLVLDGVSLENLNLVPCGDQQAARFSLYSTLNKCVTPFGKRLLHQWVCAPTCDPTTLRQRQSAVQCLSSAGTFVKTAGEAVKGLPDLERILQKIHTLGLKYRAEEHPDSRAVMFESVKYNKRKIKELSTALLGFRACQKLFLIYKNNSTDIDSDLLHSLLGSEDEDSLLEQHLDFFEGLFDVKEAETSGKIVPESGKNLDYDNAVAAVNCAEKALKVYKTEQERTLKCTINFYGSGKTRYQMEIPESKNLSDRYELKSKKKGYGRYYTEELVDLIGELVEAESMFERQAAEASRIVFAQFDDRKKLWASVVQRVATFDVLLSFAKYAQTCGLEVCQPEFIFDSNKPLLSIGAGYHPCLATNLPSSDGTTSTSYISNDSRLGGDHPTTVLLTGPNMGGKSTLMRQVAVLTVMAHMGCMVPARSMKLTPVDRIFTRIGANDRIMCGQSTFFVELNETQIILRDASAHSLVLIDELGRGTSTFDGTAIASAVLAEVQQTLQCRAYFSTHYHSLCDTFADNKNIGQAHMACMVENESEDDPTEECVTFLYRLTDGVCPKSYGFYAAKLAGVRDEVVRAAFAASRKRILQKNKGIDESTRERLKTAAANGVDLQELEAMVARL